MELEDPVLRTHVPAMNGLVAEFTMRIHIKTYNTRPSSLQERPDVLSACGGTWWTP